MIDLMKTKSRGITSYSGKFCHFLIMLALIILSSTLAQDNDYWANAPSGKTKIFAISFADEQNGRAISAEGEVLVSESAYVAAALDKSAETRLLELKGRSEPVNVHVLRLSAG